MLRVAARASSLEVLCCFADNFVVDWSVSWVEVGFMHPSAGACVVGYAMRVWIGGVVVIELYFLVDCARHVFFLVDVEGDLLLFGELVSPCDA